MEEQKETVHKRRVRYKGKYTGRNAYFHYGKRNY